ncbi:MAG TPA: hypothetical protein VJG90_01095 [Candidatus Nanoarchaeia archaeon]|nr:hypothetical protein [Candidatus Nanoarchaeia archaeon]
MPTFNPHRDIDKVVEDLESLFERDRISEDPKLDQVTFQLRIPQGMALLEQDADRMRFRLVVPYRVGGEELQYLITPAQTNGFGNLAFFHAGFSEEGGAFKQRKKMSKKAAGELAEIFIHNRPGLKEAEVTITETEPRIYETDQAALKGVPLNALSVEGRLKAVQPYVGYARMAEVGVLNGLQRYIREEFERGYSHPARGDG